MKNIVGIFILLPILIFIHLLMAYIQMISSKNYFYGVYVKNINLNKEKIKIIDKSYKKRINYTLVLIIITSILLVNIFNNNEKIIIQVALIAYVVLSYWYLRDSYIKVKYLKNQQIDYSKNSPIKDQIVKTTSVDTKFINKREKLKMKFKMLFGICIAISVISFAYAVINYNNLPQNIPIHWGINGKPDSFVQKNFKNVFFINIVDLSMVIMLSYMAIGTIGSRSYIDTQNKEENRKKALKYLNNIGYSLLLITLSMQIITSTNQIFTVSSIDISVSLFFITIFIPILGSIFLIYSFIMLSTLKSKKKDTYIIESDDEKWIYGFIYYNKDDPSFMVEKRLGAGWTFNMAHKVSQIITIFLILIFIFGVIGF